MKKRMPKRRGNRQLESRLDPQAGKPAPRGADIPVGGFWGLSSPQSAPLIHSRSVFFVGIFAVSVNLGRDLF